MSPGVRTPTIYHNCLCAHVIAPKPLPTLGYPDFIHCEYGTDGIREWIWSAMVYYGIICAWFWDPTIQVKIPVWMDDDIFDFALSFLLYFHLQAKKGVIQDDRTQSILFLNAITEPAYADVITTLYTCATNYVSGLDDGYLPPCFISV